MPAINPHQQALWDTNIELIRYELDQRPEFVVTQGLGGPEHEWFTCRNNKGTLHRVKSKFLPLRANKQDAERDLYCWLRWH